MSRRLLVVGLVLCGFIALGYVTQAFCQEDEGGGAPAAGGGKAGGEKGAGKGAPVKGGGKGAGGKGAFDPAAMRQAQMDRIKTQMGATDDEFKAIQSKIEAVQTAERVLRSGSRRGPGGQGAPAATNEVQTASESLGKLLEDKAATPDALKKACSDLRDARNKAKADLEKAQKELKDAVVANPRWEAACLQNDLIN